SIRPEMIRRIAVAVLATLTLAACARPTGQGTATSGGTQEAPRNYIVFLGDGVGVAYWTAARLTKGELAVETMRVAGLTDTRSSDSDVTDSAAGATVYATGVRTYNGAIGVGDRCRELFA